MRREKGDSALLLDMRTAAQAVSRFLTGKTRDDFLADEILRGAVERKIEIIGEAANAVSALLKEENTQIPWRKIVATRHIFRIN